MTLETLIERPAWSVPQAEKEALILEGLNALTRHHAKTCPAYVRILDRVWGGALDAARIEDVPFLPVSLFKEIDLRSMESASMVLQSSGTTGQRPSRVFVDSETATLQSRALVASIKPLLGDKRIPMLMLDTKQVLSDARNMTARGAGVLGFMKFGAKTQFALDAELSAQTDVIKAFLAQNGGAPFLMFGFTWLVWTGLYQQFADGEIDLSKGILFHSGGWKKLTEYKVSNDAFRTALKRRFGLERIYNFYGMVEQIGSVFLEASDGCLYPSNIADIIVRDDRTWMPVPPGVPGLIQLVSLLPHSYPGHSLLTEDLGEIVYVDRGIDGRLGKAVRILGRVARAELRGCSDVIGTTAGA